MGIWNPGSGGGGGGGGGGGSAGTAATAATYTDAKNAGHPPGTVISVLDSFDDPNYPDGGERLYVVNSNGDLVAVAGFNTPFTVHQVPTVSDLPESGVRNGDAAMVQDVSWGGAPAGLDYGSAMMMRDNDNWSMVSHFGFQDLVQNIFSHRLTVVPDIAARDTLPAVSGLPVLVLDAQAELGVPGEAAIFVYDSGTGGFILVARAQPGAGDVMSMASGLTITVAPDHTTRQQDDWPTVGAAGVIEALESVATRYPRMSAPVVIALRPGVFSFDAPMSDKMVPTIRYIIKSTSAAGAFPEIPDFASATDTTPIGKVLQTVIEGNGSAVLNLNSGDVTLMDLWVRGAANPNYVLLARNHSALQLDNCALSDTATAHVRGDGGAVITIGKQFATVATGAYGIFVDGATVRRISASGSTPAMVGGQCAILGVDRATIDWPTAVQTRWTSSMAVDGRRGVSIYIGNLFCRNQASDYAGGALRVSVGGSAYLGYVRLDNGTNYILDALYGATIQANGLYATGSYTSGMTIRAYGGAYVKVPNGLPSGIQFSPAPNTHGNGGAFIHQ